MGYQVDVNVDQLSVEQARFDQVAKDFFSSSFEANGKESYVMAKVPTLLSP